MDGFDDLLTPSQSSLENNPFADPFAKRSASPDPWSSPFARQASDEYEYQERATTPPVQDETPTVESNAPLDPLDSAAHAEEEPDPLAGPLAPRSPGFRESVPEADSDPPFSEIATIRPTEPEELQSSIPVPEDELTTPARTVALTPAPAPAPTPATPPRLAESVPTLPLPPPSPDGWGPLDDHSAPIHRSYPNLVLGAETSQPDWGGPGEQENWSNDRTPPTRLPTEDESDDDKPVLQTVRQPDRSNTIVRPCLGIFYYYF
jgi:sorting nexin-1/2